jgi:hypothetical protein
MLSHFHDLIRNNSANVLYHATKDLIERENDTHENAMSLAASLGNLSLLDQFYIVTEKHPTPTLWCIAAEKNDVRLAAWLWKNKVPIIAQYPYHSSLVSIFECAALFHSMDFLQWALQENGPLRYLFLHVLISPFTTRTLYESLSVVQKELVYTSFMKYPLEHINRPHVPVESLRFLMQTLDPTNTLEIGEPFLKRLLPILLLEKQEIYQLLRAQDTSLCILHTILHGYYTNEMKIQHRVMKTYVFELLVEFLLDNIQMPSIIVEYLEHPW